MNTTPYWSDTAPIPEYPPLHGDLTVDVAVIGGGITGVTAAYLLRKQGASVALLERQRFAGRDTGHTTAHLTHVTDTRLRELVKDFGRDHAQAVWDAGAAAMTRIRETAADEGIDCEFAWVPGYLHAPQSAATEQERQALLEDAKLARELGFDAAFMEQVPFMGTPGVRFANQAKFHPRNYLAGLLQAFERAGGRLFENSDGAEIHDAPLSVKSNGHTITCGHVILATHVPLQGTRGTLGAALFQTKLAPYTTYAVGGKIPAGVVPEASFWDTNDPYDYLRIDRHERHDYAILGGADHKTGQGEAPPQHFARVEARLRQLFRDVKIEHRWSGQVVETNDGLPFIGEAVEKQFVATGYSGNGMTFGTLGGMMAADYVAGRKNPWRELFDPRRKKVLGGTWDYLRENKDYPFYFLKDRLTKPETNSLEAVPRGEGRIVQQDGEKAAAFRDEQGHLTVRSAVCPHMGCLVRWNGAEKTWDCPCHGSRFEATGDVIAGPAESGLPELAGK
ncbi:MAG TPA: FAD-dependent oxidoreductase [Chthoniobacteraceae bacterium]|jgi:glycine/D-amino acid oxidase-like deaminating enzyme/nitrite reductase/ring-hydroxylating ferredoxin subunit|nr:FAD-dependent oxidoreductase [Chthoniobacteraceae bacterium]